MKIENLYTKLYKDDRRGELSRVGATVTWEDCSQPTREIYFETEARFAEDLTCNPNAFLLACVLPAMYHGEKRITIDAEICPQLRDGLLTAMAWMHLWHGPARLPVQIEANTQASPLIGSQQHAASFLSGGIDSLATLRVNHLDFPVGHPSRIKDCLLVFGFDIGGYEHETLDEHLDTFLRRQATLVEVGEDAEVSLIPVYTNIKHLEGDASFWEYEFYGAALSAVAHAFSNRLRVASIASSYDLHTLEPHGSHPLLDPNYSSANLRIHHDGIRLTRLDKVRIVSEWNVALRNLKVCTRVCTDSPDLLNCGRCEKCIRTMMELLVVGKLTQANTFPLHDITRKSLAPIYFRNEAVDAFYRELIGPLTDLGRLDLVEVIQEKSAHFHRELMIKEEKDWKGFIKRLDRKYTGGSITKAREQMRWAIPRVP